MFTNEIQKSEASVLETKHAQENQNQISSNVNLQDAEKAGLIEAIKQNNQEKVFRLLNLKDELIVKKAIDELDAECGGSALYWAAACGHIHFIPPLIKAGVNVNTADNRGWTPVYVAAHYGRAEVITALKAGGADVNTRNDSGTTPVCAAAYAGGAKAIIALKSAGANVNTPEINGLTPLYIAVQMEDVKVISALLEAGANLKVETPHGTPLELAEQCGYLEIVELLKAHLKKYPDGIKRTTEELLLAELQKKLVEDCQNENWYLKRIFDESKTLMPIEDSYISLSIVASNECKKKQFEEVDNAKSDSVFHTIDERVPSHEDLFVYKEPIVLSDLFTKKHNEDEEPKRLMVFGRAGIGKSILCQYLVVRWCQGVSENSAKPLVLHLSEGIKEKAEKLPLPWLQKFKLVFWVKLREVPAFLKKTKDASLQNVINLSCYNGQKDQDNLKNMLKEYQKESLFILDGYDEIEEALDKDSHTHNPALLIVWKLLQEQPNVILTSRPRNLDFLWPRDKTVRKLEVMGFSNEQVENYVEDFMAEPSNHKCLPASPLLAYLKSKPSIWGVAHIPINLEMFCWLYRENNLSKKANNLSMLYQEIIEKVVPRMTKKNKDIEGCFDVTTPTVLSEDITINFLENLAYQGMFKNELLLLNDTIKSATKETLRKYKIAYKERFTIKLLEISCKLGFLFSTGQGGQSIADQSHYFIHLSFQEHFGARYVASHLTSKLEEKEQHESTLIKQIQGNKHHPRYQLMWWLTAGLLAHKGIEENNYDALKIFSHYLFLGFLSQKHMSEMEFRLAAHCLDECMGVNKSILSELLDNAEHENLKEKMRKYFSYFIFYSEADFGLVSRNIKTLEECSNFLSSRPFIDALFFKRLIAFAERKKSELHVDFVYYHMRKNVWKMSLKIPECANQVAEGLIALAQDKSVEAYVRCKVSEMLLKIPECASQATERLIALAQDKSVEAYDRCYAWEILLEIPECANQTKTALIALSQDESVGCDKKIVIWRLLLKIPECASRAAEGLIAFVQDKSVEAYKRCYTWEFLLKIPECANQTKTALIALSQDESVDCEERIEICKILLKIPEYASQAAENLIVFAQDKRIKVWIILLGMPKYTTQARTRLLAWVEDKNVDFDNRIEAWKALLEIPENSKEAAERLIVLARDKSVDYRERIKVWKTLLSIPEYVKEAAKWLIISEDIDSYKALLKMPEYARQAAEGLIVFAQAKSVEAYGRLRAWEILLRIPEHVSQAEEGLIALAQDKSVEAYRTPAWEILLRIPEYARQAAEGLIVFAQDKRVEDYLRREAWETLLRIPEHTKRAATGLIALAQNGPFSSGTRIRAWQTLLKIPQYANQAAIGLIELKRNANIDSLERSEAWEILLSMPEHAKEAKTALIALARDANVYAYERIEAWKILLLTMPEHINDAPAALIALAQDKDVYAWARRQAWETLLEIPEYSKESVEGLIALAQDKSIDVWQRIKTWKVLLKISEHAKQAAGELIALAKNKDVYAWARRQIWETLLAISEYSKESVEGIIAFTQEKSVTLEERMRACRILLEIPEHAKHAREELAALKLQPRVTPLAVSPATLPVVKVNPPEQKNPPGPAMLSQFQDITKLSLQISTSDLTAFLRFVAEGEQNKAEAMLKSNPALVLMPGDVTDLSQRTFKGITAFQYAVWALDWHMWTMIRTYMPDVVAKEQAEGFETGSWVKNYGIHAQYLLDNLSQALQTTIDLCEAQELVQSIEAWVQKVGGSQLLLPAHVINEYCHPGRYFDPVPNFRDVVIFSHLPRTRMIDRGDWFTAECDGKLAEGFAIIRGRHVLCACCSIPFHYFTERCFIFENVVRDRDCVCALSSIRTAQREELIAELRPKNVQKKAT